MDTLEKLQSALDTLNKERTRIQSEGWYLQDCWLVQVKPGGTARTNRIYWQLRSRTAMFDGKKLKHLKQNEVDDYKAAIARGQQLKQIDRSIEKYSQQLEQLTAKTYSRETSTPRNTPQPIPQLTTDNCEQKLFLCTTETTHGFTDLIAQENLVKEVIAKSQQLRVSLRHSLARSKALAAINLALRRSYTDSQY
jgi:type I site-specific restriction-modification system R (restriction) subunit